MDRKTRFIMKTDMVIGGIAGTVVGAWIGQQIDANLHMHMLPVGNHQIGLETVVIGALGLIAGALTSAFVFEHYLDRINNRPRRRS